ncbi:MAG: hypothetical protein HKN36_01155 [Hellea sp.]|nr:hypothetical protein [Hellea sp.]
MKSRFRLTAALSAILIGANFTCVAQAQSDPAPVTNITAAETPVNAPGNAHNIKLTDLAGLELLPESDSTAMMLTDGAFEAADRESQPTMIIISSDSDVSHDPDQEVDLELVNAVMFYLNDDMFKSLKTKDTSLLTIADFPSAEVLGKGKGIHTKEKLLLVQWMMFSTEGRFIRIIAHAPKDEWETALPRFEQIRDGMIVDPKTN